MNTADRNKPLIVADRARRLYWRLLGPKTIGVRAMLVDGDRILLVRHTYGTREWQLPGGGVRRRETVDAAVRRETREETGLVVDADPGAIRLHGVFSNLRDGKSDHVVAFVITGWRGTPSPADREIAAAEWMPMDGTLAGVTPGTRRRIDELRSGTAPPFHW